MRLPFVLMAPLLAAGNILFCRFDPRQPLWRRILKIVVTLAVTAAVPRYFGTVGVIVWFAIVILPVVFIHAAWLPGHGVNGWTAGPATTTTPSAAGVSRMPAAIADATTTPAGNSWQPDP
jgi:hypothetical protein